MPRPVHAPVAPAEESKIAWQDVGAHDWQLEQLTAMGFPRDEAKRALEAAFFNVERATEYLVNVMKLSTML